MKYVRHVLDIRLILISVGRQGDEGYSGNFQNGTWKFCKGNPIVGHAWKQNTLYVMHAWLCRNEANVAANTTNGLRHKSLCHVSQKGMRMLAKKEFLSEVKNLHLDKCVD